MGNCRAQCCCANRWEASEKGTGCKQPLHLRDTLAPILTALRPMCQICLIKCTYEGEAPAWTVTSDGPWENPDSNRFSAGTDPAGSLLGIFSGWRVLGLGAEELCEEENQDQWQARKHNKSLPESPASQAVPDILRFILLPLYRHSHDSCHLDQYFQKACYTEKKLLRTGVYPRQKSWPLILFLTNME